MPSISHNMMSLWRNYHLTAEGRYVPRLFSDPDAAVILSKSGYPDGTVRDHATINCSDLAGESGPAMFAATSALLQSYVAKVLERSNDPFAKRPAVDLVPIGRGWSFAPLIGAMDAQIDLTGLSGFAFARRQHMARGRAYPASRTAFVLGGTRLRELLNWAQRRRLSVKTSGTHLGLTIAGAIATASHGSRLGFGGIQDMITGIHLVTGPDRSVWIERKSRPVLDDATIATFTNQPPIRDDDVFGDALVHLGGMGLVNGVTIELVRDAGYDLDIKLHPIDRGWLADVAAGRWRKIAGALGYSGAPVFYELTINPFGWDRGPAVHTLYRMSQSASFSPEGAIAPRSFADLAGGIIADYAQQAGKAALMSADPGPLPPPDAFGLYRMQLENSDTYKHPPRNARWSQIHPDDITGGYPGALYNASFAVRREEIAQIMPLLCAAVEGLAPTFLFTLRFVSNASGTLAFTRFPESCVIEIDGFSRNAPIFGPHVGEVIVEGARRMRACLGGNNAAGRSFDYSMHWGKLGDLDRAKVWADFGAPGTPGSRIDRWRRTRQRLLTPQFAAVLWSKALVEYGLIDPPPLPDELPPPPQSGSAATESEN
ncbi:MAG: FAD-binding protein [Porphyrobacter sp.]|nr:FAD-binding protein [Porphyrobacter sp.]